MTTRSGFTSADFREQAERNFKAKAEDTAQQAYELGKSTAFLMNAADYVDRVNEVLREAVKLIDDNAVIKKIEELLK